MPPMQYITLQGITDTIAGHAARLGVSLSAMRTRVWKWQAGEITEQQALARPQQGVRLGGGNSRRTTTRDSNVGGGNDEWKQLSGRPRNENLRLIPELSEFERLFPYKLTTDDRE